MNEPTYELEAFFAGAATDEQLRAIEAWLHADPANAQAFMEQLHFREIVGQHLREKADKTGFALAELARLEHAAESMTVTLHDESDWKGLSLTRQQWRGALSYIFDHAIHAKATWVAASAAALILVATLVIMFMGDGEPNPMTYTPPPALGPDEQPVAATLLRSIDARWLGDAAEQKATEGLHTGRHYLLEGLAEIGFPNGVRVVLEAPVSFELTNKNSIELSTGRLVANVPPSGHGFTVDTPTARIIDYGTEFGVEAGGASQTRVQVFDGEVGVAARRPDDEFGDQVMLREQQAAMVDADQESVVRIAFDAGVFERRVVRRLDVVDIVAGGDGTSERAGNGIDLNSGQYMTFQEMSNRDYNDWNLNDGQQTHPVPGSKLIDSVFVIDRVTGRATMSTEGERFSGFPTMPEDIASGDSFGFIQAAESAIAKNPGSLSDFRKAFSSFQRPGLDERKLVIHSGAGVTIDLEAIRRQYDGGTPLRFTAHALNVEALNQANRADNQTVATADLWVIIDGKPRFERRSIRTNDGVIEIDVALEHTDRFLTLAVSHGGDGINHDWVFIGKPLIEIGLGDYLFRN